MVRKEEKEWNGKRGFHAVNELKDILLLKMIHYITDKQGWCEQKHQVKV